MPDPVDLDLVIAMALAECAPTPEEREYYSIRSPYELPGLVRGWREVADSAEGMAANMAREKLGLTLRIATLQTERDGFEKRAIDGERHIGQLEVAYSQALDAVKHSGDTRDAALRRVSELEAENGRLREAMEFYAAPETWLKLMAEWRTAHPVFDCNVVDMGGGMSATSVSTPGAKARAALARNETTKEPNS